MKIRPLRPSFLQKPETKFLVVSLVEKFSRAKTNRLKTDSRFEVKTKVVGDFKVYNFHEENFSKFGIDLQEKGQTLETDFGTRFL